jgi:hypothetical protein
MQYLDLENVHAGMVVGMDVCDTRGQLLLEAGCTLTESELRLLRQQRISRVPIASAQRSCDSADNTAATEGRMDARFRLCDDRHPLIHELRRLCRQRGMRAGEREDND